MADQAGLFKQLRVDIVRTTPWGPPLRRLEIDIELHHSGPLAGVILGCWIDAKLDPGGDLGKGYLMDQQHRLHQPATLPASGKLIARLTLPIASEVLAACERERTDRVGIIATGHALISPVNVLQLASPAETRRVSGAAATRDLEILGPPIECQLVEGGGDVLINTRVAASEWIKYLRRWRWSEVELFEISLTPRSELPEFKRLYEWLRKAEKSFHDHDYEATLGHARSALESMAKVAGEGKVKSGYETLFARTFQGESMRANFDALVHALNDFAHAGRHATEPLEPVTRDDALFTLRAVLAIVERLSR